MAWFDKILRTETPAASGTAPGASAERTPPQTRTKTADPHQLRLRLADAMNGAKAEEAQRLTQDLGAALAQARQAPLPGDSAEVQAQAIIRLNDKQLALSWLDSLTDEASLATVALQARLAEVRLGAARHLVSSAVLERVANGSRDKDKGVYRHCSALLQQRQAESASATQAALLQGELERLLAENPLPAPRLVDLEKAFQQLAGHEPQRCGELMGQFRQRVQEQARLLQRLHARLNAAQTLATELMQSEELSEAQLLHWRQRCNELLEPSDAWPDWLAQHKDAVSLKQTIGQIQSHLDRIAEDFQRVQLCEAFLAGWEQDPARAVAEGDAQAWEALTKPDHNLLRNALQARWVACQKRHAKPVAAAEVAAAVPARSTRPVRDPATTARLIDSLAGAIDQGHLIEAGKIDAELVKLESAAALPHGQAQRLARVRADLLKLRGWARWGNDQARQQLIVQAEQLPQAYPDVATLAPAIDKLRQEWKKLDVHAASNKGLWQQFDSLVELAYAPVAAHRAELAARLQAARQAREALCLKWEEWLAQVAWEFADMKAIQAVRQEIGDSWRALGAPGARERRGLQKRYEKLLAGIDSRIDDARRLETERCEALVAAAQELVGEARVRQAIEGIKKLQQRWRDEAGSVRLARAEQEKLWKRFRSACDAVFARREEEKNQQAVQRAQLKENAQARLKELQDVLESQDQALVRQRMDDCRSAWREVQAGQVPASVSQALQRAEAHLDSLQASKREAPARLLAQKTALIEQLETAIATSVDAAAKVAHVADAQSQWQALPRLPARFEQPLAKRLAGAAQVTASSLAEGCRRRGSLLLDLELALGLASDAGSEDSRRNRHLQMLQQKFQRGPSPADDLEQLVVDWHALPATPDAQQQQRMTLILQALRRKTGSGVL